MYVQGGAGRGVPGVVYYPVPAWYCQGPTHGISRAHSVPGSVPGSVLEGVWEGVLEGVSEGHI